MNHPHSIRPLYCGRYNLHPIHLTLLAALLLALTPKAWSQAAAGQVLRGHVPAAVSRLQPLHRLDPTHRLQLAIGLPLQNQAALDQLLQDIYNPASPNFRHFLTPEEFTQQFGPTPQAYAAVTAFLATNGFTVQAPSANRMVVDVEGAVADIERTFHLQLQVYPHPTEGREFFSPASEPRLDLIVPVLHIGGLDNFVQPRPLNHPLPTPAPTPAATPQGTGSGPGNTLVAGNFRAAYVPGVTLTGTGQSVALAQFAGYNPTDIQSYEASYGLPSVPLANVLLDGITSITANDGGAEPALDIEMAISMAPGLAKVITYYGSSPDDIYNRIASDNLAKQVSTSWTFGIDATTLQIYQELGAQGQSCFNASGDSDAYNAAANPVQTPADAPYLTIVGGTTLTTSGGAGGTYVGETVWNWGNGTGSSGGVSPTYAIPAWQQGLSMTANLGSTTMRNLPDVALTADNVWVLYNSGSSGAFGGTSCASPLWAGFMALVNQQGAANGLPPIGFINPTVYALGKGGAYATDFHDITAGNNTSTKSPGNYYAVPGYDLCTGWGTPNGISLINAFFASGLTVPNFSFETPGVATYQYKPAGGSWAFTAQSGTTGSGLAANRSAFTAANPNAPNGVQVAFLQGLGTITQTLSGFVPGTSYGITFSAAQRGTYNNGGQTWNVMIGNTVIGSFSPAASATNYTDYVVAFKATAASQSLSFVGTDTRGGDNTILLDNVRIAVAPNPPTAPVGLTAAAGNAQIALTWTPSAGASGYQVGRATTSGGPYAIISTTTADNYTDLAVVNGTTYYYVVSAAGSGGVGASSTPVSATPVASAVNVPNYGFETPGVGTYQYNPGGASWAFTAQSGANGSGIAANGSAFTSANPNAPNGAQVAFLQGSATISQALSGFLPGTSYTVSFSAAQRGSYNNGGQTWNVTMGGTSLGSFSPAASATSYATYSASFTASAATETLSFVGTDTRGGDNTILLDNVRIAAAASSGSNSNAPNANSLPSPWLTADIGAVGVPGSATDTNGLFAVAGSGTDIWGAADAFHYVYQPASGDCSIQAEVLSVQNTAPWAKAGVMIRETTNANSIYTMAFLAPVTATATNGLAVQQRTSTGGTTSSLKNVPGLQAPYWVRLARTGNSFVGSSSADGTNWTALTTNSLTMATNVYIGLPVCSVTNPVLNNATFNKVTAVP